jgi:hypothetical protein
MSTIKDKPIPAAHDEAIDRRLRALEAEVARLKSAAKAPKTNIAWVERIAGSFIDDADYKEAMRLGRVYRRRQPKC